MARHFIHHKPRRGERIQSDQIAAYSLANIIQCGLSGTEGHLHRLRYRRKAFGQRTQGERV